MKKKSIMYKAYKNSNYNLHFNLHVNINNSIRVLEDENLCKNLNQIIQETFKKYPNCSISNIEFIDGIAVEIDFETTPNVHLSNLIANFKTVTSRLIRKNCQDTLSKYGLVSQFWESKYFISTY